MLHDFVSLLRRCCRKIGAANADLSAEGLQQSGQGFQQRAFAAAAGAHDDKDIAFINLKTDVFHQDKISVSQGQVADFYFRLLFFHMFIALNIKVSMPVTTIIQTMAETTALVAALPTLSALRPLLTP